MDKRELGSKTAKGGFANEKAICKKFNAWKKDIEAQEWLRIMGYDVKKLDSVKAIQVPTRIKRSDLSKFGVSEEEYEQFVRFKKADAQIRIIIKIGNILKIENLSLKKANKDADYNQIDKRSVDGYQEMWKFSDEIAFWLKLFTGELEPKKYSKKTGIKKFRDKRRLFLNEMSEVIQNKIIKFFDRNRIIIISDIIKGRGGLSADWMLVTRLNKENKTTTWTLKDINVVMNFFGKGEVCVSPRGSLYIGRITTQRKGGTPDPTKLQFKIKPCQLFKLGE
ncbi:MAG: type II restriction endonuclease [Candidatus Cloacimonadota bacterium]|nr:type II restriction endonuclease [Candidatus Cloacimonadota bacterium]